MPKAEIYQQHFLLCPWCGEQSGCRVDHLYLEGPITFGPWYCLRCRKGIEGKVDARDSVEVWRSDTDRSFSRSMALLKIDGWDGRPVWFVMDHDRYRDGIGDTDDEANQQRQRALFEDALCPTNWLHECVAVIKDANSDPHGVMSFVRAIDVPEDFEPYDADWPALFPEAFDG